VSNINALQISGRLTADPETIADGKGARFNLASNRSYRKQGGDEWTEEVVYIAVTAWNGLGKRVLDRLAKGSQVFVHGRLELNTWEQDGQKRSQIRAVALEVDAPAFYGPKANEQQSFSDQPVAEGAAT
jgi:single-strand DNA-binding protein